MEVPGTDLPVAAVLGDLRGALSRRGTAVVVAPPGSGKSTLVPPAVAGMVTGDTRVVVTQPRRTAVRSLARVLAERIGEPVGETVGYAVRDERRVGPRTRLEVVTSGLLVRRIQADRSLTGVGAVILDEVHERHIADDLAAGLTLAVRQRFRPDLWVVAMSATLDSAMWTDRLGADLIEADGGHHPVEIRWRPRTGAARDPVPAAVEATLEVLDDTGAGDVLVFLPGVAEIDRAVDALRRRTGELDPPCEVWPLHGSLDPDLQDLALRPAPDGRRRVVVATDIAETSLTVAGVRHVVDAGLCRRPRHDPGTGLTRIVTVPASRWSTEQRAGRAGRTGPGLVVRLWSSLEHAGRPRRPDPEVLTGDVTGLVLELALWGDDVPLPDAPSPRAVAAARDLLRTLGALDDAGAVTARGARMAGLGVHPRLGAMLASAPADLAWTACVLATLADDHRRRRVADTDLAAHLRAADDDRRLRRRAGDLARRLGVTGGRVVPGAAGSLAAAAWPDRVARAVRAGSGRFRLPDGSTVWVPTGDPLADATAVVAVDVDARGRERRLRLGARLEDTPGTP